MAVIKAKEKKDHLGDTTAKGSFTISEDNGDVTINLNFSVKKTGINGTGKGAMAFILTGDQGKEVYRWDKGFTVGAELDGEHTKHESAEINFLKWEQVSAYELKVDATSNTIGIPTDISGWVEILGENLMPILEGLDIGGDTEVGGWLLGRLK